MPNMQTNRLRRRDYGLSMPPTPRPRTCRLRMQGNRGGDWRTAMRDMMANHDRLESHSARTGDAVRKVAAATFEALPALLLAAALLMPALAAIATPDAGRETG